MSDEQIAATLMLPKPPPGYGPPQYGPQEGRPHVWLNPSSGRWCEHHWGDATPRIHAYKLKPVTVKAWIVANCYGECAGFWQTREAAERNAVAYGGTVVELTGQYTPDGSK